MSNFCKAKNVLLRPRNEVLSYRRRIAKIEFEFCVLFRRLDRTKARRQAESTPLEFSQENFA